MFLVLPVVRPFSLMGGLGLGNFGLGNCTFGKDNLGQLNFVRPAAALVSLG